MILKFQETRFGTGMELIPENMEEVAQLFRMRQNTLKKPASIVLGMHRDQTPSLTIWFKKVNLQKQKNFL